MFQRTCPHISCSTLDINHIQKVDLFQSLWVERRPAVPFSEKVPRVITAPDSWDSLVGSVENKGQIIDHTPVYMSL